MIKLRLAIFSFLILPAKLWIHISAFLVGARFVEKPVVTEQDPPHYGGRPDGKG